MRTSAIGGDFRRMKPCRALGGLRRVNCGSVRVSRITAAPRGVTRVRGTATSFNVRMTSVDTSLGPRMGSNRSLVARCSGVMTSYGTIKASLLHVNVLPVSTVTDLSGILRFYRSIGRIARGLGRSKVALCCRGRRVRFHGCSNGFLLSVVHRGTPLLNFRLSIR